MTDELALRFLYCLYTGIIKRRNKALLRRTEILNKSEIDADSFGIFGELVILSAGNSSVKRRLHIRHRSILIHKAYIDIVAVGFVKIFKYKLRLGYVRRQKKNPAVL